MKQGNLPIQVLIVEDDKRIAEINRRFVEKIEDYQVAGIANNGDEAKLLLEVLEPDLVLLDIYFPDTSGLEILKYIRTVHWDIDVIMITAAKEVDTVKESIRGGVFDFLIKPLNFERFKDALSRYRDFKHTLISHGDKEAIEQDEVDQLIRGGLKKSQAESYSDSILPKGIDRLTLEKVHAVISQNKDGLTAEDVGREIGTSRTTARRYLEYLVSNGELIADLSYGSVGRPERIYRA